MASAIETKPLVFTFADVTVREREFAIVRAAQAHQVEPKAFQVLLILIRNPHKLITKEELLNSVWADAAVTENSLARNIALLRRLLGDDPREPRFIETVSGIGYRFVCPVELAENTEGVLAPNGGAAPADETASGSSPARPLDGAKTRPRRTWLFAAGVAGLGLAACAWYLHRPLPLPRITAYTQLTHDGHEKWPVGTDGNRIYFTPMVDFELAQVSVAGGEIAEVKLPIRNIHFVEDVSPDGTELIVATGEKGVVVDRPQWNVSVLGGSLHRLPDGGSAAFSPDGRSVAYSNEAGEIGLVQADGAGARRLASIRVSGQESEIASSLAWSPDGGSIRFALNNRLWEISSNGSNLHEVLPGWQGSARQCCGRWTADGKFFIFVSPDAHSGTGAQIWAIDERRSLFRQPKPKPVQLTGGTTDWGWLVSSKDGTKIFAERILNRGELSRFDAKYGRFQPFLAGISAGCASFTRDGKFVAYVRYPEGTLWRANGDGSNPVQLTGPPGQAFSPRWSPDGKNILYAIGMWNGNSRIYVIPAAGGSPRMLPHGDEAGEEDASWSSDGQRIAFAADIVNGLLSKTDIQILDLATQKVEILPESVGFASARWSPDGRFITGLSDSNVTLKIYDTQTKRWTLLLDKTGGLVSYPAWSSDSRWVYVLAWMQGYGVYRIPVTGGKAELVAPLKDWAITGWWGWMGLDANDAPMVLHDIGSDDIYALTLDEK